MGKIEKFAQYCCIINSIVLQLQLWTLISATKLKKVIVTIHLTIQTFVFQFWEEKSWNLQFYEEKSELWGEKSQLPFVFLYSLAKASFFLQGIKKSICYIYFYVNLYLPIVIISLFWVYISDCFTKNCEINKVRMVR